MRGHCLLAWLVVGMCLGLLTGAALQPPDTLDSIVQAQVALDWLGLSPGIIDGKFGPRTASAVMTFQQLHELPITAELDRKTMKLLTPLANARLVRYSIRPEDIEGLTGIPENWSARSLLKRLNHETVLECLAERSHADERLLRKLNPGVVDWDRLKPGQTITMFDFSGCEANPAERVEISLTDKTVTLISPDEKMLARFHCSVGANPENRPTGTFRVTSVLHNPPYAFDPKLYPESGLTERLTIPPGPNNPVGTVWIGISRPGFGIHGTPDPQEVGRTGSHGCFRLTNWDTERVARMVRPGTPVLIKP